MVIGGISYIDTGSLAVDGGSACNIPKVLTDKRVVVQPDFAVGDVELEEEL